MSDTTLTGVLSTVSGILTWTTATSSRTMVKGKGYLCTSGGVLSFLLPEVSIVGDCLALALCGADSWTITQRDGQYILIDDISTSVGTGGSLDSTSQGNAVSLVCVANNAGWVVVNSMGNITVI